MKEKFKLIANKFKEFNRDTYGMLITVSWILLVICLVIKLFGGNWFELWWDNEKFIAACNYVENNTILKMIVACVMCLITNLPIIAIMLNKNKMNKKEFLLFSILLIVKSVLNWYITGISFVLDLLILIILPLILSRNWKRILFANLLILSFQVVTIVVRNISFDFNLGNTVVENILYQVDYILMIMLFYFYYFKNKKRKEIK